MNRDNKIFKISRELYGDSTVTYNNIQLVAFNKFNRGDNLNFNWGDMSPGSEALSYAILEKAGSKEIASKYSKSYTKDVISKIKKDSWTLNATAVIQWIEQNTNYSIDESAFIKDGSTEYDERRQEERRKEERRVKREKDFQEEAQRRLKIYEEKQQERRQEDRRVHERRQLEQNNFRAKSLSEIQVQYEQELDNYKKQIVKQNTDIQAYQAQLKKYKAFIESLDIKSIYTQYCKLEN